MWRSRALDPSATQCSLSPFFFFLSSKKTLFPLPTSNNLYSSFCHWKYRDSRHGTDVEARRI